MKAHLFAPVLPPSLSSFGSSVKFLFESFHRSSSCSSLMPWWRTYHTPAFGWSMANVLFNHCILQSVFPHKLIHCCHLLIGSRSHLTMFRNFLFGVVLLDTLELDTTCWSCSPPKATVIFYSVDGVVFIRLGINIHWLITGLCKNSCFFLQLRKLTKCLFHHDLCLIIDVTLEGFTANCFVTRLDPVCASF